MSTSLFARTALAAAVAIVAVAPAMAQNTTAAIGGRVVSPDGKPVAGATVVVLHRESGSVVTLTTDAEGRYSSRGLRVGGPYTVTVSKGGEKTVTEEVYLALAETTMVDLRLGAAQTQLEQVVVTGSAAANSKFGSGSMGAGTQIGRQDLETYASIQRNLQDYVRNDPRISQTDKERGEISAVGQNTRYNSVTIDGVRTNDTFGLEANNLPTIKQPISIDAIQAVQVSLSNYDVTQQGYTGASINAVTKSGTNEFHGSVYGVYRDSNMSGKRFNRSTGVYSAPPPSRDKTYGFTLGGPIIQDKLFFFANYEKLETPRNAPTFGPVGSSLISSGITNEQIAAAQAAASSKYGMEIGKPWEPSAVLTSVEDKMVKLDWNISEKHRASVRYSKTEQSDPIFPFTTAANGLALDSHFYTTVKTLETKVAQWFADWTEDFTTELKISQRDYSAVHNNNADLPQVSLVYTASGQPDRTLRFGQEESRHFNRLATKTTNSYFAGNLFMGDHELKAGFDAEQNDVFNAFQRGSKGVYEFRGTDPIALFLAGTPTLYSVQLPLAGKTLEDGAANFGVNNLGLFMQDTWTVSNKLTLNAGVRVDRLTVDGAPIRNADASTTFGYDNSRTMDGAKLVQPRFGFNYAFDAVEKRKSQVRGGFGLFGGAAPTVWITNPFQNTGVAIYNPACSTTGNNICPSDLRFTKDTSKQPDITGVVPASAVDFVSPDAKQPSVWKMNLAWDTELPVAGLTFGAEWLYTKVKDSLYYRHLNLGSVVAKSPDGRDMYWSANGLDADCWTGGTTPVTAARPGCAGRGVTKANALARFTNVLLLDGTDKGGGNALTLSLSQRPMPGLSWSAAYTRTSATEVSPLTSTTSNSGWLNRAVYNQNENTASNSNYLIQNRFNANVSWSKALIGSLKTTFGVTYEGRSGKPYSWVFNNDMNGDGVSANDLLYIPANSGEVVFTGSTVNGRTPEQRFWDVVDANKELRNSKGRVVERNGSFAGFTNSFDLRLSQEVPSFFKGHKGTLSLDILNFGNLLNRRWGRIDEINFPSTRRFVNFNGVTADGKMVYNVTTPDDFITRQNKGESQWAMQVTARYEF
ncbi:TonB-dependent receptor [Inhella proteolytica]|uniref:TonB-dependent receptor n=1 Tax=Inhella proteolytica TaxID=2795029 RepID=A0A931NFR1_9BURK|nr:TonB-dependent receptor [Inhella proteolytica]MBH9579077.1 TonB-dependent receptor [Inhella proteolytica]